MSSTARERSKVRARIAPISASEPISGMNLGPEEFSARGIFDSQHLLLELYTPSLDNGGTTFGRQPNWHNLLRFLSQSHPFAFN
jgi:hypothetical protein